MKRIASKEVKVKLTEEGWRKEEFNLKKKNEVRL